MTQITPVHCGTWDNARRPNLHPMELFRTYNTLKIEFEVI
jgi:hypothetical protein